MRTLDKLVILSTSPISSAGESLTGRRAAERRTAAADPALPAITARRMGYGKHFNPRLDNEEKVLQGIREDSSGELEEAELAELESPAPPALPDVARE
jgi:hypothetical protein